MNKRICLLGLLLIAFGIAATGCSIVSASTSKPTEIISSPPSNSEFHEGDQVAVQSTATDPTGIARVELAVDGQVVRTDPSPNPQVSFTVIQSWKATSGAHTLTVRAVNTANVFSDPAAVTISVLPLTATPAPTATSTPSVSRGCVNNSAFVADVTVPDGTVLAPNQPFNKIWRVRNTGTCAWGAGDQLVFVSGEAMTPVAAYTVPATAPGGLVDLLVTMTAPAGNGNHFGQWRLKDRSGAFFGTVLTVTIVVPNGTPPPRCSGSPNISSFTATSTTISQGSSTTLQWGLVLNADFAEIDNGIGGVATPGSVTVSPGSTTTYTLTAHCGSNVKTATVTITVVPPPPPFSVTSVSAAVSPTTFSGACPAKFDFSASIAANGAGTVTYRWERSDGTIGATQSLTFSAASTQTVTMEWSAPDKGKGWALLHILTPNDSLSNQAAFNNLCSG